VRYLEKEAEDTRVDELFLELSSETRLSLLRILETSNLKTQEIANRIGMTATEAVRQLQRLTDALLIQRNPDGSYSITEYGRTMLDLAKSMEFVFEHKGYFSTHDLRQIPSQFVSRIGELSKTKLSLDTMETMDVGQRILSEAKEFSFATGEGRAPALMIPIMNEQVRKGVKMKFIVPESQVPTSAFAPNVETRGLSFIPVIMVVSEREAAICFRFIGGRADYAGFIGADEVFRNWVNDLFLYYWNRASRYPIPKEE